MLAESTVNALFRFFAVFSGSTSESCVSLLAVTKCSICRMSGGTYDSASFIFGGIDRQPFTKRCAVGPQLTMGSVKSISTEGGAYIEGSVDTRGGDFIGRDQNVFIRTLNVLIGRVPTDYERNKRELETLLEEVKTYWIDGVLVKSVYASLLIEISKEQAPQYVDNPWDELIRLPEESDHSVPIAVPISDIFEESRYSLLILGSPGSGKTTALLEIALYAIEQIVADREKPVPVVLHLSTWSREDVDFARWIVAELNDKYGVSRKRAQLWIDDGSLLFLLDGLNEVHSDFRLDCVHAINRYVQERGPASIVICSRLEEYETLNVKLRLRNAVLLYPLSDHQLEEYLDAAGSELHTLKSMLQDDLELQELARSPLMLGMMSIVYQNRPIENLRNTLNRSTDDPLNQLFSLYINRMFEPVVGQERKEFTHEQTMNWLSWLAQKMLTHDQSVFSIEGLQPTWLSNNWQRLFYSVGARSVVGLAFFLAGGLGYLLAVAIAVVGAQKSTGPVELLLGLAYGAGFAVSFWVASILAVKLKAVPTILLTCMIISAVLLSIVPLPESGRGQTSLLSVAIGLGLVLGLPGGLAGLCFHQGDRIEIFDTLQWNWRRCLQGLVFGLVIGLVSGFVVGLLGGQPSVDLWADTMIIGLPVGFIGFLFYGISRAEHIDDRLTPNQGIHRSGWNAFYTILRVLLICTLLLGIPMGIIDEGGPRTGVPFGWALGILLGVPISLSFGLYVGGSTYIQHGILRLILFFDKRIPWDLANFLSFSTEIALLRRVGGRYLFMHALILEYLAGLRAQG